VNLRLHKNLRQGRGVAYAADPGEAADQGIEHAPIVAGPQVREVIPVKIFRSKSSDFNHRVRRISRSRSNPSGSAASRAGGAAVLERSIRITGAER
jgi:hypothetical protein